MQFIDADDVGIYGGGVEVCSREKRHGWPPTSAVRGDAFARPSRIKRRPNRDDARALSGRKTEPRNESLCLTGKHRTGNEFEAPRHISSVVMRWSVR
jgi:hypothetical protein